MLPKRPSRLLPAALALLTCACAVTKPSVFSSDPPGAKVIVDGVDSGFVTPCAISLPDVEQQVVDLEVPGYETASRVITNEETEYWILFREMTVGPQTWRFPLWLNFFEALRPQKVVAVRKPGRVFVRLRRQADL